MSPTAPAAPHGAYGPVTIIVVATGNRNTIDRAIESARRQLPAPAVVVVCDEADEDCTAYLRQTRQGGDGVALLVENAAVPALLNRALQTQESEFIGILHGGDLLHAGFLESMLAELAQAPEAGAVFSDYVEAWEPHGLQRLAALDLPEQQKLAVSEDSFVPSLSLTLFRRRTLVSLGGFDAGLPLAYERELLARVARSGEETFRHVERPLVQRSMHGRLPLIDKEDWSREMARAWTERFGAPASCLESFRARSRAFGRQMERLARPPQRSIAAVVATRNRLALLKEALISIDRQTVQPDEIIIVDDGSTDGTWEWLQSLDRAGLRIAQTSGNLANAGARNLGNAMAKSEIIAALDDDDAWYPDYLESIRRAFALEPEPCFVGAETLYRIGTRDEVIRHRYRLPTERTDDLLTALLGRFPYSTTLVAFTKERFDAVGGYDPALRRSEDYDLYLRLLAAGEAFLDNPPVFITRPLAMRRIAELGRDAEQLAELSRTSTDKALEKFFATDLGQEYRALEPAVRERHHRMLAAYFRDYLGVTAEKENGPPSGDGGPFLMTR